MQHTTKTGPIVLELEHAREHDEYGVGDFLEADTDIGNEQCSAVPVGYSRQGATATMICTIVTF